MTNKEKLQQIIWPEIGKISVATISKVTWYQRSYIQQRIYWDVWVSQSFYNKVMEWYEFVLEAQKSVYKR